MIICNQVRTRERIANTALANLFGGKDFNAKANVDLRLPVGQGHEVSLARLRATFRLTSHTPTPEIPMIWQSAKSCMTGLLALTLGLGGHSHAFRGGSPLAEADPPALLNTCLVTNDVARLTEFYERVLQIPPKKIASEYVEFPTEVGVLAIFSGSAQEKYIPHSAEPGNNRSAILEFRVLDADKEYKRLQTIVTTWVKPPTTQPWGTRSIYFRDPDGNLVDFFTPPRTAP